jgi:hypothetical protein
MLYEEELTEKISGAAIEVHRAIALMLSLQANAQSFMISVSPCLRGFNLQCGVQHD